jgi:hypothetical protein
MMNYETGSMNDECLRMNTERRIDEKRVLWWDSFGI